MANGMGGDARRHGLPAYGRVLATPRVLPLVLSSLLARLPLGMGSIAVVLYVQDVTGSFAAAGAAAGAFTIGIGVGGPPQARLVDRRGARFLLPAAMLSSASLVAMVLLGGAGAGSAALAAAAGLAGFSSPPLGGVLRRHWPEIVEPHDLPTIYAVDSILIEILFLAGPLFAGLFAAVAEPGAGLIAAAAVSALGSLWFLAIASTDIEQRQRSEATDLAGALASPTVRLLVFTGVPAGALLGALDVTLPAFGALNGDSALGGPLIAAIAVGSMAGGLAFGARPHAFGHLSTAFLRLGAFQLLTCLPLLLVTDVPQMFLAAAVAGLCIAPLMNVRFQLAQTNLTRGSATEAFTWVVLALTAGTSLGSAVTGPLVQSWGWHAGAIATCAFPALAVALALLGRDHLPRDDQVEAACIEA